MTKKFLALLMIAICSCVAMQAQGTSGGDDAIVNIGVIRPLTVDLVCPSYCNSQLPHIIIGSTITVPNHMIAFIITGEPSYQISITTDGPTYQTSDGVTMIGEWGSYSNGTLVDGLTGGTWIASDYPESLSPSTATPPGIAYYNYVVKTLYAPSTATAGFKRFKLNISAEYVVI